MAPRNSQNAQSNKTLRTACSSCGKDIPTDVGNDPEQRTTWSLVGERNGALLTFAVCSPCYQEGWRPQGWQQH